MKRMLATPRAGQSSQPCDRAGLALDGQLETNKKTALQGEQEMASAEQMIG
jgi:hypothetical protein